MEDIKRIEFVDYMRDYCNKKYITAYELSNISDVSLTYCYRLLKGDMKNSSLKIVRKLSNALGINYENYLRNGEVT